jgi:wobble nucleotide-excising tRNase
MNLISVVFLAILALYGVEGKRGASGRVPLGKFRVGGVQKAKVVKPLTGDQGVEKRHQLIEQQKKDVKLKQEAKEKKLRQQRDRRDEKKKGSRACRGRINSHRAVKDRLVKYNEDEDNKHMSDDIQRLTTTMNVVKRENSQRLAKSKSSLGRLLTARRGSRGDGE